MKTQTHFKPYEPNQLLLLPPDMRQWLPDDDLVYFLIDVVKELDLSAVYSSYDGSKGGQPPYNPTMMTSLLLYAYCIGLPSSRKIEQATHTSVPFRVIAADQHPDHDTIAEFRKRHLQSLAELFVQILQICRQAGLVKLGHVALYGKGKRGDELPQELRSRQSRLKKIREAMDSLESEAKEQADAKRRAIKAKEEMLKKEGRKRKGRKPKEPSDSPEKKAQRNFTDPQSRIMKDGASKSFEQCYNCQAAVDEENQIIVATHVTQQANDKQQLEPLVEEVKNNTGGSKPGKVSADSGYFSEMNVMYLEGEGIDGFIATNRQKHSDKSAPARRGRIAKDATTQERMTRKLRTKKGRETYSKRKQIVEPVFGQTKEVRGFRRFSVRGILNVSGEWDVVCLTHNLLKLFRSGYKPRLV